MNKTLLFTLFVFIIFSCSSIKNTQEAVNNGNYDTAINSSLKNLKKDKLKKGNQPYVLVLEEAFKKATAKDLARINFLKKDNNPENIEAVFGLYEQLHRRQELIKPLLPLYVVEDNREADFQFINYDEALIENKNQLSEYLYAKAKKIFNTNNKLDYRVAYYNLEYLEKVNPNFKDVRTLMLLARERGLDFVIVSMKNKTQKVIPKRLEDDLLDFNTYGFDDFWTVYHAKKELSIQYDFGLELALRSIQISPERISEKQIIKEIEVKDGVTNLLDDNGEIVLDKDNKPIKVDKMVPIRCKLYHFTQFKSTKVTAKIRYIDLSTRHTIESYPIASEFVFQHRYATHKGDKRALGTSFKSLIEEDELPFPSNEQMIYDAGQDLKQQLKSIVIRKKFRD